MDLDVDMSLKAFRTGAQAGEKTSSTPPFSVATAMRSSRPVDCFLSSSSDIRSDRRAEDESWSDIHSSNRPLRSMVNAAAIWFVAMSTPWDIYIVCTSCIYCTYGYCTKEKGNVRQSVFSLVIC